MSGSTGTVTTEAPRAASAIDTAGYTWSVTATRSPGPIRNAFSTVATPVVAFGTNASPAGSAPRNDATTSRASATCDQ